MFTHISVSRTLVAGALIAALSVAACSAAPSGPSVAALAGTTTTTTKPSSPSGDPFTKALAFSACMRSHGVPDFPDPKRSSGGNISLIFGSRQGINPQSSTFQAAQRACQSLQPGGGPGGTKVDPTKIEPWAACIRSHGVPNLPDPSNSNGAVKLNLNGTGLTPNSTQFQKAMNACRSLMPGGAVGVQAGGGS